MGRRRAGAASTVAVLVAVVAVAGCGGVELRPSDLADDRSPIASPSAAGTSTPPPTARSGDGGTDERAGKGDPGPPSVPGESRVRAFVKGFIAADNHASATGDYRAWDQLVSDCAWCARKRAYVKKIYDSGGTIEGELFTQVRIGEVTMRDDTYVVPVDTVVSAYTELDGSGEVIDKDGATPSLLTLYVKEVDGRWRVVRASWVER